jgi:hypothetical protein
MITSGRAEVAAQASADLPPMTGPMPTNRRTFRFIGVGVAVIALLAVVSSGAGVAASTPVTFTPTDDAEADSTAPSTPRGPTAEGRVDGDPIRRVFLRFNVSGLTTPVSRATLRLYSRTGHSIGFDVRNVASTDWSEATLTHDNAPASSATIAGSSGSIAAGTWERRRRLRIDDDERDKSTVGAERVGCNARAATRRRTQ